MTYKERLTIDRPSKIDAACDGGCVGCPCNYGYTTESGRDLCKRFDRDCERCWNSEMPGTENEEIMTITLEIGKELNNFTLANAIYKLCENSANIDTKTISRMLFIQKMSENEEVM